MKFRVDTEEKALFVQTPEGGEQRQDLYGQDAFALLSEVWLKAGWDLKYTYDWKWLGRPVIQLPEDLVRLQELVWEIRPDVVVETGVAHGGSAIFFASLMQLLGGDGRVVAVEVELRQHNREALEEHPFRNRIEIIEGSSIATDSLDRVRARLRPEDRVMVMLDSNHTRAHVAAELKMYAPLVSPGSALVVADGVMSLLHDVPRGKPEWREDNPLEAVRDFLASHSEFELDPGFTRSGITYFQGGCLRRRAE